MKKLNKKGFTLIEMLIVVVIIGILAAALIPRLGSAKGKANDSSRSTALGQVGTMLGTYVLENGWKNIPAKGSTEAGTINQLLLSGGMVPPTDPSNTTQTLFGVVTTGGYAVIQVQKTPGLSGIAVVAGVESESAANWVEGNINELSGGTIMSNFPLCTKVSMNGTISTTTKSDCKGPADKWRKIVVY